MATLEQRIESQLQPLFREMIRQVTEEVRRAIVEQLGAALPPAAKAPRKEKREVTPAMRAALEKAWAAKRAQKVSRLKAETEKTVKPERAKPENDNKVAQRPQVRAKKKANGAAAAA